MSRVAKKPIDVPTGLEVKIENGSIYVKGKNGEQTVELHKDVVIEQEGEQLLVKPTNEAKPNFVIAGTMRSLVNNAVTGVTTGFEKRLLLVGVGYRVKASGQSVDLTLGFSHPVVYNVPKIVKVETPSQTEIVLRSSNKQVLGQVAAEIRAFRPPEPYKGKGVRYADERIRLKEAKKK